MEVLTVISTSIFFITQEVISMNYTKKDLNNKGLGGLILGIGYNSRGRHKSREGKLVSKPYLTWRNMLSRCYCPKLHNSEPTYIGCTVDSRWHDFQNFAEWLVSHDYYNKDYHLDKDLLLPNNKIYSSDRCALVPREINNLLNDRSAARGENPIGVYFHKRDKKYVAQLMSHDKKTFLGYFDCPQEAHQAYVVAKEAYVKEVANEWRGRIDERAYEALMRWTVKK